MFTEEHLYAIALRECALIGDINFQKLVNAYGSAKNAWEFAKQDFANTHNGLGRKHLSDIGNINHIQFAENELKFCEQHSVAIILRHQNEFPSLLHECIDAPAILYSKGEFSNVSHSLSIVGTRNMTNYGKGFLEAFFEQIQKYSLQTVSGLALGVDTCVHELSLQYKIPTVAVLAHGFTTLYPSKNRKLSEKILQEKGVLLTEFNSSKKPDREHFIQRNRVIAGLSPSTMVIETGFGGGSMSTANFANIYNRDVFALPGKITDPYSQGCNQLILQNKASIISTVKDLIYQLGYKTNKMNIEELFPEPQPSVQLTSNQEIIYTKVKNSPHISLDDLSDSTGMASHKLLPIILELEILGKLQSLSGRKFLAL